MPKARGSNGAHHTTRQKGTANRSRNGRSTYSIRSKNASRDRYGTYASGVLVSRGTTVC